MTVLHCGHKYNSHHAMGRIWQHLQDFMPLPNFYGNGGHKCCLSGIGDDVITKSGNNWAVASRLSAGRSSDWTMCRCLWTAAVHVKCYQSPDSILHSQLRFFNLVNLNG